MIKNIKNTVIFNLIFVANFYAGEFLYSDGKALLYMPQELMNKIIFDNDKTTKNFILVGSNYCKTISDTLFDIKWDNENQLHYRNERTGDKKSFKLYRDPKKIQHLILNSAKSPYIIASDEIKNLSSRKKEILFRTLFIGGIPENILFKMQKNEITIFNDLDCKISNETCQSTELPLGFLKQFPCIIIEKNKTYYAAWLFSNHYKPKNMLQIDILNVNSPHFNTKTLIKFLLPQQLKNSDALMSLSEYGNNNIFLLNFFNNNKDIIIDCHENNLDFINSSMIKIASREEMIKNCDLFFKITPNKVILNPNKKSLYRLITNCYVFVACNNSNPISWFEQKFNKFPLIFPQLFELKDIFNHDIAQIKKNNNNISSSILFKIAQFFNNKVNQEIEDTKSQQVLFSIIEKALSSNNWTKKQLKKFTKTIVLPEAHNAFWASYDEYVENKLLESALDDIDLD